MALGFQIEMEFGNVGFWEGGKPENPEKNPRSKDENKQQTQPTYDIESGNGTRATLVGGKCSHHRQITLCLYGVITVWNLRLYIHATRSVQIFSE